MACQLISSCTPAAARGLRGGTLEKLRGDPDLVFYVDPVLVER